MRNALVLSLLSGVLLSLGWIGVSGLPLLVALVPLLLISGEGDGSRRSFWKTAGYVALSLAIWSGVTTWWIWYAAWIGAVLSVLITVFLFGGIFMLFHYVSKRSPAAVAYTLFAAGWIACEYLYTYGEVSFPWLMLGNGFANDVKAVQWYDTTGIFGGSLWVLVSNTLVYTAIKSRRATGWIAAALFIAVPLSVSLIRYHTYRETGDKVTVTVVQPNIEPYFEKFVISQQEQTAILMELSRQAPPHADWVVMPETAINEDIWENDIEQNSIILQFKALAAEYPNTQFIVGATTYLYYMPGDKISRTARRSERGDYWYDIYNTALAIDAQGPVQTHHKSLLVVGVEKMPYYGILKHLEFLIVDLGGTTGQLGVDTVRSVFVHPRGFKAASMICYESVYGRYFSEFVKNGAQIMFVITNDGWWGDTFGYRQHFSFSRLRAVETRRSVARSANTGISGFINQRGDVLFRTKWDERTVATESVALGDRITFYTRYGDYVARISILVFSLCVLYFIAWRVRRKSRMVK